MSELILIVEDEAHLVENLEFNLRQEGYEVRIATDGASGLEAVEREPIPDLVVLDLMLPDLSGIDVCRRIRSDERTRRVPVLILTARGEEVDRVTGFEAGADDYVVKPFSVRELKLRIAALLRRSDSGDEQSRPDDIEFGALRVDTNRHAVWVDDEPVELAPLEFRLLETLLFRRGRVQSREVLLRDVWDIEAEVKTRTVDAHIQRLRDKLGQCANYIETVRGVGYRFVAEVP